MNAVRDAWARLCLGTGQLLHGLGEALSPGGCLPLLVRGGGALVALLFFARVLQRAPQLAFALPLLWMTAAWAMSDSSATPPPGEGDPCDGECPGHEAADGATLRHREGMSILSTPDAREPGRTHVRVNLQAPAED